MIRMCKTALPCGEKTAPPSAAVCSRSGRKRKRRKDVRLVEKKRKITALILCLCMLVSAFQMVGTASAAEGAEVDPAVQADADDYSVVIGEVRVQLLSDTLARVEVKGPKGFEDRETYHVTGRDWDGAAYTVATVGDMVSIATADYVVYVPVGADSLDDVYMTDAAGKVIWAYTSLPEEPDYLPDPGDTPKAWAIADTPRAVPSEWGYAPLPEGETDNGYNGWDMDNDAPDMYIFVPMNDAKQLRQDFIHLTGSSEMVPFKALGLWYSCFRAFSEESALEYVQTFRDKGFPLDYFVMDTDWRTGGSHGYTINTSLLPDITRFFDRMHTEQNVNVVFNDHPESQNNMHALEQDELIFRNANLSQILEYGLDSWWFDRNWTVSIISPFDGIPKESFGMYLYHDVTLRTTPNERALVLSNADGIDNGYFNSAPDYASHRYSVQWTGDIGQMSDSLKREITNSVRAGAISSTPYVAPDIGGHYGIQTNELHARWSQFGAFAPIFRYHSVSASVDRSPWLYGETAENTAREYINMRYRLMPLYYSLSHENYENGMPILRRLDFNYPQYAESQDDTEYTIGDNVLVAPLYEAGEQQLLPAEWTTADGGEGLYFEYFNNTDLTGTPAYTGYEAQVDHYWGYDGPGSGVNTDNFSARWSGTITLGDEDARIAVKTDDGVRLYIDGVVVIDKWTAVNNETNVSSVMLEAGTTHEIKIEYYEGTGAARMELYAIVMHAEGDSREVFIPDGNWIDVWTGESYEGPQTITQSHGLSTSPLFVRSGTILPLVDNVEYLGEKAWDSVTLDVYPSTQLSGTAELYEDDTTSNEYKDGAFRTTALETSFDKATGEVIVSIGAAEGVFEGSDAFNARTWSVRVHAPEGWGEVTGMTVDGQAVTPAMLEQSAEAAPFAVSGPARDADVYTVAFEKPLSAMSEVRIQFASPKDETLPEHNAVAVDYTSKEGSIPATVDLDALGSADWMAFDETGEIMTKRNDDTLFAGPAGDGETSLYTGGTTYKLNDGKTTVTGCGISDTMFFDVAVGREEERISLYITGDNADGVLEITDGVSAKIISLEAENGGFAKRITVDASASGAASLQFTLRKTDGEGVVALMAVAVGPPEAEPDTSVARIVSIENAAAGVDLSDSAIKDWVHLGLGGDTSALNRKNGVDALLSTPVFSGTQMPVYDFPGISFSDGTPTVSASGSQNAVTCYQGTISFSVPSGAQWQELKIYTGAYQSTNTIKIYDDDGIVSTETFSAEGVTQYRVVTVKFRSEADASLYIESSGTGHMFIAAYTLSDLDDAALEEQTALAQQTVEAFEAAASTTPAELLAAAGGALTDAAAKVSWSGTPRVTAATADAEGRINGTIRVELGDIYLDFAVNKTLPKISARLGDVNEDGGVTVSDVVALRGLIVAGSWTDIQLAAGDFDENGLLSVADVVALRSYIVAGAFD
jgi:alpha-glucosidase (family GH31 glycosyl hydrolase)